MPGRDARAVSRFGRLLQEFRKKKRLSQTAVARSVGCHPVAVSNYERGIRIPTGQVAERLADALGLNSEERGRLVGCVKTPRENVLEEMAVVENLQLYFESASIPHELKQSLAREVKELLESWKRIRGDVQWAVIPAAGWQAIWLGLEATGQLVKRALMEAKRANIKNCVVVIRPHQEELLTRFSVDGVNMRKAIQDTTMGLGHAIRTARESIPKSDPFAVILPDESVSAECLSSMIEIYRKHNACVVGLTAKHLGDEEDYGIAQTRKQNGDITVDWLKEKPGASREETKKVHRVLGRYILAPSLFVGVRETAMANHENLELSTLLNTYCKNHVLFGYEHKGQVRNVGPARRTFRKMLEEAVKVRI